MTVATEHWSLPVEKDKLRCEETDAVDEWDVRYRKQIIGTVCAVPFIPGWFHGKHSGRIVVTKPSRDAAAAGLAQWCGF